MKVKQHTIKTIGGTDRRLIIEEISKGRLAIGFCKDKGDTGDWLHCHTSQLLRVIKKLTA